jgi:hypothetical protein
MSLSATHHQRVRFEMDFTPGAGWTATAIDPEGWVCVISGTSNETREQLCDRAYEAAQREFGEGLCALYSDTNRAIGQAIREDEQDPARLSCPLCNPEHPEHETALGTPA